MTPSKILVKARDLLDKPSRWNQGGYARSAKHRPVEYASPKAICWCAAGAVYFVSSSEEDNQIGLLSPRNVAMRYLGAVVPTETDSIASFNDRSTTTYDDIICLFDTAIGMAAADEEAGEVNGSY